MVEPPARGSLKSERDSEHVRSFRTHAAYLRALRHLAVPPSSAGAEHDLAALADRARAQVRSGTVGRDVSADAVLACLNRAWGTELILATTAELADDSEVIRLANSWGSVQAYYALYGAVQAVLVAEGRARPDNHEATRKAFVDLWVTRRIELAPWTFALGPAGGRGGDSNGFLGGPGRPLDLDVHPWSSWAGTECWDVAGKALRGTRKNHLEEQLDAARSRKRSDRRKQWRQEEQTRRGEGRRERKQPAWWDSAPRLTAEERVAVERGLRPTTLMDHLYRLRIRANYEDALLFTEGPETDRAAQMWAWDLVRLTSASLLVHEMRLAHLLGDRTLRDAADAWLARNRSALSGANGGLAVRRAVLWGRGRSDSVQPARGTPPAP